MLEYLLGDTPLSTNIVAWVENWFSNSGPSAFKCVNGKVFENDSDMQFPLSIIAITAVTCSYGNFETFYALGSDRRIYDHFREALTEEEMVEWSDGDECDPLAVFFETEVECTELVETSEEESLEDSDA